MNELRSVDGLAIEPFDDTFRALKHPWKLDLAETAPRIKIDVTEQEAGFGVKAEIPGERKEDVDVRVDGNQVTISAELKTEKEEKVGTRVLRRERQQGFACRTFTLGCAVDEARADAKVESGVLNLSLPKNATASTRRVAVK
jgi:HSP20 family protein